MQNHTKGILYASTTAFFWGFLAIALKVAVREVEPVTIVWFRFVVAFAILSVIQLFKNPSAFKIVVKPPLLLLLAAVGLSWNYFSFMLGVHYTTPSNAQLFIQTGPIMLAIAGIVFFKEKIKRNQIIGFSIAIAGLSFFYSDQLTAFFDLKGQYNKGVLLVLSSAMAWAIYAISQKKLVSRYSVESLNLFLFGFPALLYLPFVNFEPLFTLHWTWWLLLVFLGANTFIAYTCLAQALKYIEANRVSMIIIINPIITFITMAILTEINVSWIEHERFSVLTFFGAILVISGAILVAWKRKTAKRVV